MPFTGTPFNRHTHIEGHIEEGQMMTSRGCVAHMTKWMYCYCFS